MIIGVFAGAMEDTNLGAEIVEGLGEFPLYYPFSRNPIEQTKMQYYSKDELNAQFRDKVLDAKSSGAEKIFLYCNSLSLSVDYEEIGEECEIEIITPLETYGNLEGRAVAVLGANGFSAYRIDQLLRNNPHVEHTLTMGILPLVEAIERDRPAPLEDVNLKGAIQFIEGIKVPVFDTLLIGCTHFYRCLDEIRDMTKLSVIDPTEDMIAKLKA